MTAPDAMSQTAGRYGWWGGYGTSFFVAPDSKTVAILLTQRTMEAANDTAISDEFLKEALAPPRS